MAGSGWPTIENLLEFRGRLPALSCFLVRDAAYVSGIESSELGKERCARQREVVRKSPLQSLEGFERRLASQRSKGAQRGKVAELNRGVLRKASSQVLGEPLKLQRIT